MMLEWNDELQWLSSKLKGKSLIVHILKLAWGAFVYFVWEERNKRLFRNVSRTVESILCCIKEIICIRTRNRVIRMDDVNRIICTSWGFS